MHLKCFITGCFGTGIRSKEKKLDYLMICVYSIKLIAAYMLMISLKASANMCYELKKQYVTITAYFLLNMKYENNQLW